MPLSAGQKLGPYEILAPIGAGGMGEVWKARDTRLDRIVAIKVSKTEFSERFEREARAIAALNHPHICQIYDVGLDYLVMEFADGKPLSGPLPAEEALRLAIQIAGALEYAHARGILHRDLKPANILVTGRSAKLLDFGLAKSTGITDVTQTIEGAVIGTPAYMAPEQIEGKPADARSEVFSFGAVLYEALSGKRAFDGLASALRAEPARLDSVAWNIVKRCLAKQPGERFQGMAELRTALEKLAATPVEPQPSIAVLPFANLSRDADDEYFSDGLSEEIINALTQVAGLKVIARTSAFAFKGRNEDIRKIAETLGVTSVLEGSVRRAGNRLRVTAQLIHAADGMHLWSQRYDREMTDVFEVQDEISAAITVALQGKLALKPAARPHEPDLPAYEAFLKGRREEQKYSPENFERAVEYYQHAIALDPRWAAPHAYLGIQYVRLVVWNVRPMSELVPLARAEARKALDLFPSEPAAHAVLGIIAGVHDYDWEAAAGQFRLAMAAESLPPAVRDAYALYYLTPVGRFAEAIRVRAEAIAEDPLNPLWRGRQAATFFWAGKYEEAIAEARKTLELDAANINAHTTLVHCCIFLGKLAEARQHAEELVRLWPAASIWLASVLRLTGEWEQAEKIVGNIGSTDPKDMAFYHLVGSEIDAALDCYEQAIGQRNLGAVLLAAAAQLQPLRAHPRWPKLAKMMNLPGDRIPVETHA